MVTFQQIICITRPETPPSSAWSSWDQQVVTSSFTVLDPRQAIPVTSVYLGRDLSWRYVDKNLVKYEEIKKLISILLITNRIFLRLGRREDV